MSEKEDKKPPLVPQLKEDKKALPIPPLKTEKPISPPPLKIDKSSKESGIEKSFPTKGKEAHFNSINKPVAPKMFGGPPPAKDGDKKK
jgi:hypothetical protein